VDVDVDVDVGVDVGVDGTRRIETDVKAVSLAGAPSMMAALERTHC